MWGYGFTDENIEQVPKERELNSLTSSIVRLETGHCTRRLCFIYSESIILSLLEQDLN